MANFNPMFISEATNTTDKVLQSVSPGERIKLFTGFCSVLFAALLLKMHFSSLVALGLVFATAGNAQTQYTATGAADVAAARATARTLSPTSSVKGRTFDRFVNIWLENTDFDMAAADRSSPLRNTQYITF